MTLKIGDKVRFLNDVGGGIVTAFIDNKMVEVRTDDGFEIPILATELVRDAGPGYGMNNDEEESENIVVAQETTTEPAVIKPEDYRYIPFEGEAFLAIIPENERLLHVSDFKLYLINDSNYDIRFTISQSEGNVYELVKSGTLEPETKMVIKQFGQSGIGKLKAFRLQAFFTKEGLFEPQPAIDVTNSLEGISFYKASEFSENEFFDVKAIVFRKEELNMKEALKNLSKNELLKIKQEKDPKPAPKAQKVNVDNSIEEVDLHIEEIVDDHSNMSNSEIIDIQLSRFETALETAIKSNTKRIVFIHGVGNGSLKIELRKKLDRKYPDLKYQDASFKEYGYGATMVTLR